MLGQEVTGALVMGRPDAEPVPDSLPHAAFPGPQQTVMRTVFNLGVNAEL